MQWSSDYLTGIELIDEQHQTLIDIGNRLYALLKSPFAKDKYDDIVAIVGELVDYTVFHFSAEEKLMEQIGYRRIISHKAAHNEFIAKIKDVDLKRIDDDQHSYLIELTDFVLSWISSHILKTDKRILAESTQAASL
ncbi:MAG: bacteriohemerythrin [Bacillota bacterium]